MKPSDPRYPQRVRENLLNAVLIVGEDASPAVMQAAFQAQIDLLEADVPEEERTKIGMVTRDGDRVTVEIYPRFTVRTINVEVSRG